MSVQIASGLKAAHAKGVVHRDIKPANCFLTYEDDEPVVKLVDFGIAKLEGGDQGHTLTGTAQVLGTPSYIAPELARTQSPAGPSTDIYSLGVVAYRMLTGVVPFTAETVFELLRKACFDPVPSLRTQVPDLPAAVEAFVLEMLAKEPAQRPADMLVVRDRLVALSQQTSEAQTIEILGSSRLPPSIEDDVPPPESTEDTTMPREAVGARTERPHAGEVGITAVVLEPVSEDAQQRQVRPPGTSPAVVPAPSVGVPQIAAHDSTSSPPAPGGETVPSVGESTLRSIEASGSVDGLPRRGALWSTLVGLATLGMVGALLVPRMFADRAKTEQPARTNVVAANAESATGDLTKGEPERQGSTGPNDEVVAEVSETAGSNGTPSLTDDENDENDLIIDDLEVEDIGVRTTESEPPEEGDESEKPPPSRPPKKTAQAIPTYLSEKQLNGGFAKARAAIDTCARRHGVIAGTTLWVSFDVDDSQARNAKTQLPYSRTPLGKCIATAVHHHARFPKAKQASLAISRTISF